DDDVHAGPILIITQLLEQRFACEGRPARVKFAQLRPGKNNAVSIDDYITRPRLHRYNLCALRLEGIDVFETRVINTSLQRGGISRRYPRTASAVLSASRDRSSAKESIRL